MKSIAVAIKYVEVNCILNAVYMPAVIVLPKEPISCYPWPFLLQIMGYPQRIIIKPAGKKDLVEINVCINDRLGLVFFFYDLQPVCYPLLEVCNRCAVGSFHI